MTNPDLSAAALPFSAQTAGHAIGDLRTIVQALSERLRRPVTLDDPQLRPLLHSSQDDSVDEHRVSSILRLQTSPLVKDHVFGHGIDAARKPVRVSALPEAGFLARVCVPVRSRDQLLGYLWMIDAETGLSDADLQTATVTAATLGPLLLQESDGAAEQASLRRSVHALLSPDAPTRADALRALETVHGVDAETPRCCVVLSVSDFGDATQLMEEAMHGVVRGWATGQAFAAVTQPARGFLILIQGTPPTRTRIAAIADALVRKSDAWSAREACRVGVGPVVSSPLEAWRSAARATDAVVVAAQIAGLGPVSFWDDLGPYQLLSRLQLNETGIADLPLPLTRLLDVDRSGILLTTLETWLDEGTNPQATSAKLNIHRASLYHRLGRIRQVTGLSLTSGSDRLTLHMGVKIARMQGVLKGAL